MKKKYWFHNLKYIPKTKKFKVKLEVVDPTGFVIKHTRTSISIIDDDNSMIHERLLLHIGECMYIIDKNGFIIERLIPKEK